MNRTRWNYLKNLTPPAPRLFWASNGDARTWTRPKGTYNVGRNAAKRQARELARKARAVLKGNAKPGVTWSLR